MVKLPWGLKSEGTDNTLPIRVRIINMAFGIEMALNILTSSILCESSKNIQPIESEHIVEFILFSYIQEFLDMQDKIFL